jgi:hypothetical protein
MHHHQHAPHHPRQASTCSSNAFLQLTFVTLYERALGAALVFLAKTCTLVRLLAVAKAIEMFCWLTHSSNRLE